MIEIGSQRDEIGDGGEAVVVDVAIAPGGALVEVGGEVDEVGDGDGFVEVEVADKRVEDEDGAGRQAGFAEEFATDWIEILNSAEAAVGNSRRTEKATGSN